MSSRNHLFQCSKRLVSFLRSSNSRTRQQWTDLSRLSLPLLFSPTKKCRKTSRWCLKTRASTSQESMVYQIRIRPDSLGSPRNSSKSLRFHSTALITAIPTRLTASLLTFLALSQSSVESWTCLWAFIVIWTTNSRKKRNRTNAIGMSHHPSGMI